MTGTTRPRGFAPWQPQRRTRELLAQITEVLDENRAHLPLTVRQVFYRLVANFDFDKTEAAYNRLCETFNRARRAGLIQFDAIRDDGVSRLDPLAWGGVSDFTDTVATWANGFRLDRQSDQPRRLWVLCEARGMAPMLARVADPYGVPVMSSGGFDSLTAKHDLAREMAAAGAAEVLHIGDYDPSGEHVFSALAEDVGEMVRGLGRMVPVFSRLAVIADQIEAMKLPTAPPKATDRRKFSGVATVQAEAIPPDDLAKILRTAIEERQDAAIRADTIERERNAQAQLQAWIGGAR